MVRPLCALLLCAVAACTYAQQQAPGAFLSALARSIQSGDTLRVKQAIEAAGNSVDLNAVNGENTLLITLLAGWQNALDRHWPDLGPSSRYAGILSYLLEKGADASKLCPLMDAVIYRNMAAMETLVTHMTPARAAYCLTAHDAVGQTLLHSAAKSGASGLARLFFRLPRSGSTQRQVDELQQQINATIPVEVLYPGASGGPRVVSKARVDRGLGTRDLSLLLATGRSSGAVDMTAWLHAVDHENRTALYVACAEGRADAAELLLLEAQRAGGSDAVVSLALHAAHHGYTPAHAAASRGFVTVLAVLAKYAAAALTAVDERGVNACGAAAAAGVPAAVAFLTAQRACDGSEQQRASAAVTSARPTVSTSLHQLTLQRYDASHHAAGGWVTLADAGQLQEMGLNPALFTQVVRAAAAKDATKEKNHPSITSAGKQYLLPPSPGVLGIVELSPSILDESAASNATLRALMNAATPFIIRGAYKPTSILHTARAMERKRNGGVSPGKSCPEAASGVLCRDAFLRAFGNLTVSLGPLPYASTYGYDKQSQRLTVTEFVTKYMGNSSAVPLPTPQQKVTDSSAAVAADGSTGSIGSTAPAASAAAIAAAAARPYVFDANVIPANLLLFQDFQLPAVLGKSRPHLRQFALGGAGTGAMPHFHGAALNLALFGVKLWVLTPPADATFVDAPAAHWYTQQFLPSLASGSNIPYGIVLQEPGDLMYVPHSAGHAVLNLADTFALAYE